MSWRIPRARPQAKRNKSYAYPNPFSPEISPNGVRFEYDKTGLDPGTRLTIRIYDFALDLVATVVKNARLDQMIFWNGISNSGKRVANGTYIYTIIAGNEQFWGKVTVRN